VTPQSDANIAIAFPQTPLQFNSGNWPQPQTITTQGATAAAGDDGRSGWPSAASRDSFLASHF